VELAYPFDFHSSS